MTSCTSLIWLFDSDALKLYLYGYSEQGQDKGLDLHCGAARLLARTLVLLWCGHGAVGSRANECTCMQMPVREGLMGAMPSTWPTNRPCCLLFANVEMMGGPHFVLSAVRTQSGGKPAPKCEVCYPILSRGFLQHSRGLYPRICDPELEP